MKVIEQLIDYLSQRDLLTQEHFDRLREQGFDAHIPAEIRERWELKEKESPGRSKPVIEDLTDVERLHEQLELQTLRGRSPGAGKNGRQRRRLERIAAAARDLGHRAAHAMEGCDHALKPFVVVARSLGVGTIDSWRDAARVIAQAEFLNDIIPWLAEAYETEEKSSEREIAEFQERVAEVFRGSSRALPTKWRSALARNASLPNTGDCRSGAKNPATRSSSTAPSTNRRYAPGPPPTASSTGAHCSHAG